MEDKLFDLMTQMYVEFKDFKKDMTDFKEDMTDFKKDMTDFKKDMTDFKKEVNVRFDASDKKVDNLSNQFVRFENEIKQDISALYDGYKLTYEKLGVVEQKVDNLCVKVEKQDVEIKVIKRAL